MLQCCESCDVVLCAVSRAWRTVCCVCVLCAGAAICGLWSAWSAVSAVGFHVNSITLCKQGKGGAKQNTTKSKSTSRVFGQSSYFCSAAESYCAASAPNGHVMRGLPGGCAAVARPKGCKHAPVLSRPGPEILPTQYTRSHRRKGKGGTGQASGGRGIYFAARG